MGTVKLGFFDCEETEMERAKRVVGMKEREGGAEMETQRDMGERDIGERDGGRS